MGVSRLSWP